MRYNPKSLGLEERSFLRLFHYYRRRLYSRSIKCPTRGFGEREGGATPLIATETGNSSRTSSCGFNDIINMKSSIPTNGGDLAKGQHHMHIKHVCQQIAPAPTLPVGHTAGSAGNGTSNNRREIPHAGSTSLEYTTETT